MKSSLSGLDIVHSVSKSWCHLAGEETLRFLWCNVMDWSTGTDLFEDRLMLAALWTAPGAKGSCKFGSHLCFHLNSCLHARLEGSVRALSRSLDVTHIVYTWTICCFFFFFLKLHRTNVNNRKKQMGMRRGWLYSRDERSRNVLRDFSGLCSCALKWMLTPITW